MTVKQLERFASKFVIDNNNCWVWQASLNHNGYGQFSIGRKSLRAHRAMYESVVGEMPDDLQLDHLCRNRACVNPSHLEAVTGYENLLRGDSLTHKVERKACKYGHPYSPENTRMSTDGRSRICRECHRQYNNGYKKAKRLGDIFHYSGTWKEFKK